MGTVLPETAVKMVDYGFISFSFFQGVVAFFAPCAVALLPGYLSSFINRDNNEKNKTKRAIFIALMSILGFVTIYTIAGIGILTFSSILKSYMPWIAISMGAIVISLGIFTLFGKNMSLSFHLDIKASNDEKKEAYLFGISYGIGALGCLFPLFLVVATSAISAPNIIEGVSYIVSYVFGMSLFMLLFSLLAVHAKSFLQTRLKMILPHINIISAVLMIFAGIYIIHYQLALVL
jgi:cytochrome c biogenesis protein CcdA